MKTGLLHINNEVYETLLALSEEEQQRGLMFQPSPTPVMTFVYTYPRVNKFWMRNTPAPLDILFCVNNKISQICYGEPFSEKAIGDNTFSDIIIELPYGTVNSSNIIVGSSVELFKPSKLDLTKLGYLQT